MIRVAVISDSHWAEVRLRMFIDQARKRRYDSIVFCGDGLSDAKQIERELGIPVKYVAGNCDWSAKNAPRELRLNLGGVKTLVVHGDRFDSIKWDLSGLSYYAEDIGADLVLFGHTHQPHAAYVGRTLMVNPGALMSGRYAELEIEDGRVEPYLREL